MKTLAIYVTLALWAGIMNAQEVIALPETKIGVSSLTSSYENGNKFTYAIKDTYKGEFESDPMAFVKKHFNIQEIIEQVGHRDFNSYEVSFKTRKGELRVDFDEKGNLVRTSQEFENIVLPMELLHQLYRDYKGWAMVNNKHSARGKKDKIEKEVYRIKLEKGNKRKTINIRPASNNGSEVAFN